MTVGIVGVAFVLFDLCCFDTLICIYLHFVKQSCLFREALQILGWGNSYFTIWATIYCFFYIFSDLSFCLKCHVFNGYLCSGYILVFDHRFYQLEQFSVLCNLLPLLSAHGYWLQFGFCQVWWSVIFWHTSIIILYSGGTRYYFVFCLWYLVQ